MYLFLKRVFDLFISLTVFIILLPFMLPVVVLLLLSGEHYVFYYQKRCGRKGVPFDIIKFATMLKNSTNMGAGTITLRNDPRVLPLGKFLRMSKINELPQILNVLKGDMSIVGPRPLMEKGFNAYPPEIRRKIYDSVPGITGIGSVIFRDEEALISKSTMPPHEYYEKVIVPYKGELEMWYYKNKSLKVDFMIIFLTGWVILFPKSQLQYRLFKNLPKRNL